jgi:hypothetical protein
VFGWMYMEGWKEAATVSIVFGWKSRRDEINPGVVFWWRRDPKKSRGRCRPRLIPL